MGHMCLNAYYTLYISVLQWKDDTAFLLSLSRRNASQKCSFVLIYVVYDSQTTLHSLCALYENKPVHGFDICTASPTHTRNKVIVVFACKTVYIT